MNCRPGLLVVAAALALGACASPAAPGPPASPAPASAPPAAPTSRPPGPTVAAPTPAPTNDPAPTLGIAVPAPSCGGVRVSIKGALSCEAVAERALAALAKSAPALLAAGVAGIDVYLEACPEDEVPAGIDCRGEPYAQFVTVTFDAPGGGEASESGLTVLVAPISGRILGISDQLVL